MEPMRRFVAAAIIGFVLTAGAQPPTNLAEGRHGMVVSVSAPGSEVGLDILQRGGDAVDAAVATAFALAVTFPAAGNIGGGGFMLVYPGGGTEPVCIDYREAAPAASTRDMFKLKERRLGHKIVGVPGTVRGLALAHARYGKLPWRELVLPAVKLADEGFVIDAGFAASLNSLVLKSPAFLELCRVFGKPHGERWRAGDRLVQKDLARTLRLIADEGADAFYRGSIADFLVAEMKSSKSGLITKSDLANYQAKVRTPVHGTYRGYDVYGPPPPSSGGIGLVEMLNVLENFKLKEKGRWAPETLHVMIETMRRAYCDRARYLGDPDFVSIPTHLTTKEYARELAKAIDPAHATRSAELAREIALAEESTETTHFSVIDKNGMAVANTYTLEGGWGSKVVVRGAGFLLNNEMGDFNFVAGHTDRRGAIGTDANLIAPGKRMLSSMTPVVVAKDGRVALVTGSPGGRTIINTVLQVVLNVIEFDLPLRDAVEAPRLHHQWFPDEVSFEAAKDAKFSATIRQLEAMGHRFNSKAPQQGDAHSIAVDAKTGAYLGVEDRRTNGRATGY